MYNIRKILRGFAGKATEADVCEFVLNTVCHWKLKQALKNGLGMSDFLALHTSLAAVFSVYLNIEEHV